MKTIKIFLSIAGFALTTICFGQLLTGYHQDTPEYTAYINSYNNRIEHLIYPVSITGGDHFEVPLINSYYFLPLDNDLEVETWMTSPFETGYFEEDIPIESWMTHPFETSYYEEEIPIEPWMTSPFKTSYYEEEIPIEPWMTHPWV